MNGMFVQRRKETASVREAATGRSAMPAPIPTRRHIVIRLPDWSPWCRQVIRGVHVFARRQPAWRLQINVGGLSAALPAQVDGVIAAPCDELQTWQKLLARKRVPVISMTAAVSDALAAMPNVRIDEQHVARVLVQHLRIGGLRQLAYYGGALEAPHDACLTALRGIAETEDLSLTNCHQWLGGRKPTARALLQWIRRLPTPIGIIAANMEAARTLANVCLDARLRIPQDVAIVAWDDDAEIAEASEPTLSGIVQPVEKLGYTAAACLAELLAGKPPSTQPLLVPPSEVLHIRQSSDLLDLPNQDVRLALQYIREHADKPITVASIAHALQLAPRTLELNFKRATGQTPHEAVIQAHLDRAKQLLLNTSWPMDRIAAKSGFGRPRALFAAFAAREKLSPGQYRAQHAATPVS